MAAWIGFRCARISAIVCGCSPRMNFESCCGLVFSMVAKPSFRWNDRITRSNTRRAMSGPSDLVSRRLACSTPPTCSNCAAESRCWNSYLLPCFRGDRPHRRNFAGDAFDFLFLQVLEHLTGRSSPITIITMAALRAPLTTGSGVTTVGLLIVEIRF